MISRCNAMASEKARASFQAKDLEQDLRRLLKSRNVEQHRDVLDRPIASSALAGTNSSQRLLGGLRLVIPMI